MIPLRDTIRSKSYPVVNTMIIIINIAVFFLELSKGDQLRQFIFTYGLVPARYTVPSMGAYFTSGQQIFSLLSFMFIHGGFFHLLGNMWSLYIFGDNVEDRLGSFKYLLFYLLCGFASGIAHLVVNWHSQVPTIGASGAIAGVMGAYMISFPRSKILTLIPMFIFFPLVEVPAVFFLGLWFIFQFLNAASTAGQGGIAWWAHIGGFLFGIVFLRFFLLFRESSASKKVRRITKKNTTDKIQVVRPISPDRDLNKYGSITITRRESVLGAKKLVNIPEGLKRRLFVVIIPPDTSDGSKLRLSGMGRRSDNGRRGDLYLKVQVEE
jgi:membrane associated rhomboid family serine protease